MNIWNKELGKDILYDLLGSFIQALGIWCFIEPCQIAPGGVSGVAIILNYLFGLPVGFLIFIINVPILLASLVMLDREMTLKTIRTVVLMSIIQDLVVARLLPQYVGDRLISSAFGGIFAGVGMALIFMRNSTTGGTDILAKLLQKKFPYIQTGYALLLVDCVIIAGSAIVFRDIESVLYAIISLVCTTQAIDMLLYGINSGSMVIIHSSHNHEIAQEIMESIDRGTTFYKTVGGYSGKEGEALMCVVDRKQFYLVKRIIDKYDPQAFTIVAKTKEVYGEGFLPTVEKEKNT